MAPSPDHQKLLDAIDSIRKAKLPPTKIRFTQWVRIIRDRYSNGLGFNPAAESRFSDPDGKFGVIYLAQALETSVAEAIIRDRKEGRPGKLSLSYSDAVRSRRAISISATQPLNLLSLTGVGLIRFGVPTDIVRGSNQSYARLLSAAIHAGPSGFDGIRYESRFTGGDCIALYDRAISKVRIVAERKLEDMTGELGKIYQAMNVTVRKPKSR